jgi:undecaprenyl-diphosphatase
MSYMSFLLDLDRTLALRLNAYAHQNEFFDRVAVYVSDDDFLKGGVFTAIAVWLWFKREPKQSVNRVRLITVCAGAILATLLSRLTQQGLPFRLRPIHDPALHLNLPYGIESTTLAHWSSFPSDHAVLYAALATGLFWISKRAGLLAWAWTLAVISIPRLFLGLHFFSDVLAGLVFGTVIMAMTVRVSAYLDRFARFCLRMEGLRPSLFYATSLLFIWQLNTAFPECRAAMFVALNLVQHGSVKGNTAEPYSRPPRPIDKVDRLTTLRGNPL